MNDVLLDKHRHRLDAAVAAIASRGYYSAFDESPSPRVYGADAAAEGKAAFEALLDRPFALDTPGAEGTVATERSPYGFDLGVAYPRVTDVDAAPDARRPPGCGRWRDAGPDAPRRRLHRDPGPAARPDLRARQRRAAHQRAGVRDGVPGRRRARARPGARGDRLRLDRDDPHPGHRRLGEARPEAGQRAAADGEDLHRGAARASRWWSAATPSRPGTAGPDCSPRWSPATRWWSSRTPARCCRWRSPCRCARRCSRRRATTRTWSPWPPRTRPTSWPPTLAVRPEVRLIDYTGGNAFGEWLEDNAQQAVVFTEKAGVNTVVVDSTDDFAAMCRNLAFSFSLYAGQMCTAPQNVYLPAAGVETDQGTKSPAEVAAGIGAALDKLLGDDARAVELLGGVVNPGCGRASRGGSREGRGAGRVPRGHPPGVPRRHGAHAHPGGRDRGRHRRLRGRVLRAGGVRDLHVRHRPVRSTCSATP